MSVEVFVWRGVVDKVEVDGKSAEYLSFYCDAQVPWWEDKKDRSKCNCRHCVEAKRILRGAR